MAFISRYCHRSDCEHNHGGNCGFFVGDIYFMECFDLGTMYTPRKQESEVELQM